MKLKKLLAVVLSAVMAVSVLSACGGGAGIGGAGATLTGQVNGLLEKAGSDAVVETSGALNDAVQEVIDDGIVKNITWNTPIKVYTTVQQAMKWQASDGFAFAVSEDDLKSSRAINLVVDFAQTAHWFGIDFGNTAALANLGDGTIDTPEELAAALVLMADTGKDAGQSYSVAAQATETDDGVAYWVFALQVN